MLSYETLTAGQAFAAYVAQHPLDVLKIVPSHLGALLRGAGEAILPGEVLVLGGEALPSTLLSTPIRPFLSRCVPLSSAALDG